MSFPSKAARYESRFRCSSLWCRPPTATQEAAAPYAVSPHTRRLLPLTRPTAFKTPPFSARHRICTPIQPPPPWPPCPRPWTRCRGAGRVGPTPPWPCYRRTRAWRSEGLQPDSTATLNHSLSTVPVLLTRENSTSILLTCDDWDSSTDPYPSLGWRRAQTFFFFFLSSHWVILNVAPIYFHLLHLTSAPSLWRAVQPVW